MPERALSLLGFMDRLPAVRYLESHCVNAERSQKALVQKWTQARARLDKAERPGQPALEALPLSVEPYLEVVRGDPRYTPTCEGMPAELMLVEVAPLLAFQHHVSLDRADALWPPEGGVPQLSDMLARCLPHVGEQMNIVMDDQSAPDAMLVRSENTNLVPLRWTPGQDQSGAPVVGLVLGARSPYVQVVQYGGRHYLKNGFHRVYALGRAGATHVPAIVLQASQFSQVGARGRGETFDRGLLESRNPPTCGHLIRGKAQALQLRKQERVIDVRVKTYARFLE